MSPLLNSNSAADIARHVAWSNWILVLSAVVAAFIGLKTLRKINAQTKALVKAADAAKESADAARRALQSATPLLWVTKIEVQNFAPASQFDVFSPLRFTAVPVIRNFGNGPAIIIKVRAVLTFKPCPFPASDLDLQSSAVPNPCLESCRYINLAWVRRRAVATSDETEFPVFFDTGKITDEEWARMENGKILPNLYGAIEYEDVFGNRYEAGFCSLYSWGHTGDETFSWTWTRGPAQYEYNRKIDKS